MNSFYEDYKCFENFINIKDYSVSDEIMIELFIQDINVNCKSDLNGNSKFTINDYFIIFDEGNFIVRKSKCDKISIKKLIKAIFKKRESIKDEIEKNLLILNNICNYILIGCSECTTIYNIKMDLVKEIISKNENFNFANELDFITLINIKNRKSSASWDYKQLLYSLILKENLSLFKENDFEKLIFELSSLNKFLFTKLLINEIKYDYLTCIVCFELLNCWKVNNEEHRNYYLWKLLLYFKDKAVIIVKILDEKSSNIQNDINLLLFYFSLSCLIKGKNDYSSYHFIKIFDNSYYQNIPNVKEIIKYIEELENSSFSNIYINEIKVIILSNSC